MEQAQISNPTGTSYTDRAGVTITPRRRMVLMRSLAKKQSKGGIIVPDIVEKSSDVGPHELEVLAHGPGAWEDGIWVPISVRVGQRVLLHAERQRFGGEALQLQIEKGQPEKCYLIEEDFLCAEIERKEASKILTPASDIKVPRLVPKGARR